MGKIAFVFPGQGSQAVGMAQDSFEQSEQARAVIEAANNALQLDLADIMFNGPEQQLKQTYNTQPALLTASIAYLKLVEQAGIKADYVAGHSLGEYSALVAAGVLSFEDAVKVVRQRGLFMESAVPSGQGAMAAVLGAERETLQQACDAVSASVGSIELANVNCPGQIVVSGTAEGVQALANQAKEFGAKRVIPLEVSGPFHSSLMKQAAISLEAELANVNFSDAKVPVIANVTAEPTEAADTLKALLVEQVCAPVLWQDSIEKLIELGVDTFIEIGSGSVLSGLIKKINRDVKVITINSVESVQNLTISTSV